MESGLGVLILSLTITVQRSGVMYHSPQWSPDGGWILVSATLDGDADLYLISTRGEPTKKLTDNSASDDLARWIDSGRRILFTSDRRGRPELFVMNADGSDPRVATAQEQPAIVSPDGRFELREDNGRILLIERRTAARRLVTDGPWAEQPAFSPDGRFIAYEQRTTADPHRVELSNIVAANADGAAARVVTAGTDPSWSPDGSLLLFKVWDPATKRLHVTTSRPDGSGARRLAEGVHPQWSPDGHSIAFMRDGAGGTHLWVMKADGAEQRCLTCR